MKVRNIIAFSMMSFALVLATIVALVFSTQESHGEVVFAKTPTTSMTGVWHQVDGTKDENMVAIVDHGEIQITLYLGNTSGVYWDGSFDFDQAHSDAASFDVVSESNHPDDIFSSEANEKKFSYKNGILSYEFKIVGTTRTIQLQKEGN